MSVDDGNEQDSRSTLERLHARWLGPIFGLVGVVAAVFAIMAGIRSCSTAPVGKQYPAGSQPISAGRIYEDSQVGRGSGPQPPLYDSTKGAPVGALNSIHNNPEWGDERNFTACRLADDSGKFGDAVSASDGDVIELVAYLDNASPKLGADVVNTRMQFIVDATATDDPGVQVVFTGTRKSDGTEQRVWDGCGVNSNNPLRLFSFRGRER